jgi:sterol O-acyltransferase
LIGQLNQDGIASLEENNTHSAPTLHSPPRSLKAALEAVASSRGGSIDTASETASEEDYDALKHDPTAFVRGGKGGGFLADSNGVQTPDAATNGRQHKDTKIPSSKSHPGSTRLKNIPVTLNKLKEPGRYVLTADDSSALSEILKMGMERVRWFVPDVRFMFNLSL